MNSILFRPYKLGMSLAFLFLIETAALNPATALAMSDDLPAGHFIKSLPNALRQFLNGQTHADSARRHSAAFRHSPAAANAYEHAYLSAVIVYEHGDVAARAAGNLTIHAATTLYYNDNGPDGRATAYRDLYNNMIGRSIGEYAWRHRLSDADIAGFVEQALVGGVLITSVDATNPDRRLPAIIDLPFPMPPPHPFPGPYADPGFSGWPADFDFDNPPNPWTPKSSSADGSREKTESGRTIRQVGAR